jgi:uncharacterized protein YcfL
MEINMKNRTLIAAACVLVGCSSSPTLEISTPKSVVLGNTKSDQTVVNLKMAEAECQKYDRHAVAIGTNNKDKTASFECKD